ncbi:hypothetical protein LCGC14_0848600 [marine sediment metagenome]|uniref:Uncharacterized protein n=1 Tax=marine sediment metagenome TaxID=412755 RepID=A0A0F9PFS2_9ZZZZ
MPDQTNIWLWDGTVWVKAKADSSGRLYVIEDHAGIVPTRATGTGQVATGAKSLHWITIDPSGANWALALTDNTDGSGDDYWEFDDASKVSHHELFVPPMKFVNGIYIKTATSITEVFLAYE